MSSSLTVPRLMWLQEIGRQSRLALPLIVMNVMSFARIVITSAFLGRLGELELAGGTLGFTFANVTGLSVLNGLCSAMGPICGQAYGAKNIRLLHRTLIKGTCLLLLTSVPIALLWLYVDRILLLCGQQEDISSIAKDYL